MVQYLNNKYRLCLYSLYVNVIEKPHSKTTLMGKIGLITLLILFYNEQWWVSYLYKVAELLYLRYW